MRNKDDVLTQAAVEEGDVRAKGGVGSDARLLSSIILQV